MPRRRRPHPWTFFSSSRVSAPSTAYGIDDVAGERCARRGRREQNFAGKQGDDTVAERAVRFPLGDADHHPRIVRRYRLAEMQFHPRACLVLPDWFWPVPGEGLAYV